MVNTGTIAAVKVMYVLLCGVVDCGIGSRVGHEEIVWAKLKALAAGAGLGRVRGFSRVPRGPSPPALSRWERALEAPPGHAQRGCLMMH